MRLIYLLLLGYLKKTNYGNIYLMWLEHYFLVKAPNADKAFSRVKGFLDRYQLVSYEKIEHTKENYQADNPTFWQVLEAKINENYAFVKDRLSFLEKEGFEKTSSLKDLPQGYLSKELHLIVHFLDGFFGVDSTFYNLEEDSHWVSKGLKREITLNPQNFWLIKIKALSLSETPLFEKFKNF
ncbi:hypothetical protein [Thermodesulfatator autotrophicus]|uniref:hypothetical protein n=1 Tax=Thermodesulfatator autotrophicus TaxID=1795632 RepID=UPI0012FC0E53|nr:hypothetical protein [Thermodesulfatator autotrophicus]